MIHLGGKGHLALLSFVLEDCDKTLSDRLRETAIPDAPPLNVAFDITLKEGGLWGTSARLASIVGGRRKQAARMSGKKKSPANKRRR